MSSSLDNSVSRVNDSRNEDNSHITSNGTPLGNDGALASTNEEAKPAEDDNQDGAKPKEPLLAKARRIWLEKTGIDGRTYMQMLKGAISPTIAMAAYQATPFADQYTTIGYLVGIMAILSLPIQPRAKFIQNMLVNIFATCLGCSITLLAMFCAVKARLNGEGNQSSGTGTSGLAAGGAPTSTYNSSASAIAGLWLFVEIFAISVFRAKMPQFTIASIMLAIFANVSMVYAPQFASMVQAQAFAEKLLIAFFTGFAISTGVSLLIFPFSSRQVIFQEMSDYITLLRSALQANLTYLRSLEDTDMFAPHRINTAGDEVQGWKEAEAFKGKMQALAALHAKFSADLPFAKREVAIGRLGPGDCQQISRHLRLVMLPTLGLSSVSDVFQRIAEQRGWSQETESRDGEDGPASESEKLRAESVQDWHELARRLRGPFAKITQLNDEGLEHVAIALQLAAPRRPGRHDDVAETGNQLANPGTKDFAQHFDRQSKQFLEIKKDMLRSWCAIHHIELPPDFFENTSKEHANIPEFLNEAPLSAERQRLRRQLFLSLHMQFLLFNVNRQIHDLILFVDGLQHKLSRSRLVIPGKKRIKKWLMSTLSDGGEGQDDVQIDSDSRVATVWLGDGYNAKKDPEHLPPRNLWENVGDYIRLVGHFFASPASSFGFRVACATMSVAIVAFLEPTQTFFTEERLFWSQIMISISMSPSSGQSVRSFFLRVFGTFVAMVLSYIAYYIVDGKTAGVIIFYFLFLHFGLYIVLKYPAYVPVGMISQVTLTLILGYSLQTRKIGIATAESNGQAYYPLYILAPIRLATVAGGLFLAWIWTIFPYPVTEYRVLRQNLAKTLRLLAAYYSIMHTTVNMRLSASEGNINDKDSPGSQLEKARRKVFSKSNTLLSGLRAQAGFVKFDLQLGGRFPREQYRQLIGLSQSALNFMSLVTLASETFEDLQKKNTNIAQDEPGLKWLRTFRKLIRETHVTSEAITTLLSLLSASLASGSPLPPYLHVPEPFQLSQRLDDLDKDILSLRNIAEPGYSSFAVIQIATRCVLDDLQKILRLTKELVGEMDYSYHIVYRSGGKEDGRVARKTD